MTTITATEARLAAVQISSKLSPIPTNPSDCRKTTLRIGVGERLASDSGDALPPVRSCMRSAFLGRRRAIGERFRRLSSLESIPGMRASIIKGLKYARSQVHQGPRLGEVDTGVHLAGEEGRQEAGILWPQAEGGAVAGRCWRRTPYQTPPPFERLVGDLRGRVFPSHQHPAPAHRVSGPRRDQDRQGHSDVARTTNSPANPGAQCGHQDPPRVAPVILVSRRTVDIQAIMSGKG